MWYISSCLSLVGDLLVCILFVEGLGIWPTGFSTRVWHCSLVFMWTEYLVLSPNFHHHSLNPMELSGSHHYLRSTLLFRSRSWSCSKLLLWLLRCKALSIPNASFTRRQECNVHQFKSLATALVSLHHWISTRCIWHSLGSSLVCLSGLHKRYLLSSDGGQRGN